METLEKVLRASDLTDYSTVKCPFGCVGSDVETGYVSSTLLEGSGNPEEDPNTKSLPCKCLTCEKRFIKHWVPKYKTVWYTTNQ